MAHYIDADKIYAEIERLISISKVENGFPIGYVWKNEAYKELLSFLDSLQQEQPEVDLEKLGEIARHIIAVKQNVEDMRLNEDEWSLLERIGYPHKLNAGKED